MFSFQLLESSLYDHTIFYLLLNNMRQRRLGTPRGDVKHSLTKFVGVSAAPCMVLHMHVVYTMKRHVLLRKVNWFCMSCSFQRTTNLKDQALNKQLGSDCFWLRLSRFQFTYFFNNMNPILNFNLSTSFANINPTVQKNHSGHHIETLRFCWVLFNILWHPPSSLRSH